MQKVIYLDTLILLNTVVTFMIVLAVRACACVKTKPVRIIAAAFFGGVSSLLLLVPEMPFLLTVLFRLLLGAGITFIAFFVGNCKKYFRCLGLLYLMTFAGGGLLFFLSQILTGFVTYQNGFVYIGLDFWEIVAAITGSYFLLTFLRRKFGRGKERFCYDIDLTHAGVTVKGRALFDSGHFVSDCYTGKPVVIAGEPLLRKLLPSEAIMELKSFGSLTASDTEGRLHARCIPVITVSGRRMLPAFTCANITVSNEEMFCSVNEVSLAMADEPKDFAGCDALINEKLFESR